MGGGGLEKILNRKNEKVLELREMARNHIFPFFFWGGGRVPAPLSRTQDDNKDDDGMVTHKLLRYALQAARAA